MAPHQAAVRFGVGQSFAVSGGDPPFRFEACGGGTVKSQTDRTAVFNRTWTTEPSTVVVRDAHGACDTATVTPSPSAFMWGQPGDQEALDVKVDAEGQIYVLTGLWTDRNGTQDLDYVVIKLDPWGAVEWMLQDGTSATDSARTLLLGEGGQVLVAGSTWGTFLEEPSVGAGANFFLAAYDATGRLAWRHQVGGTGQDIQMGACIHPGTGRVALVGVTDGDVDGQRNSFPSTLDAMVVAFDQAGTKLGTMLWGDLGDDQATGCGADSRGNVAVVGSTQGALLGMLAGATDAMLLLLGSDGSVKWGNQWGGEGDDLALHVAVEPDSGTILLTGMTVGPVFHGQPGKGGLDTFAVAVAATGETRWVRVLGTAGTDMGTSAVMEPGGHVLLAGYSDGALEGQQSNGGEDAFILRLDVQGNLTWGVQYGLAGVDRVNALALDGAGGVLAAGSSDGAWDDQPWKGGLDTLVYKVAVADGHRY